MNFLILFQIKAFHPPKRMISTSLQFIEKLKHPFSHVGHWKSDEEAVAGARGLK
jgi:hypothetical protein